MEEPVRAAPEANTPCILISNDDGIDSPTLVPLVREFGGLGHVRVLVPDVERSWIGKAVTRFGDLRLGTVVRDGIEMQTLSGTPSDCVNLAIHTLDGQRPDVVVSGINLGWNAGLSFLLSSGTVGAAIEAWIAGVPAIAFSMGIPGDAYGLLGEARGAALGEHATHAAQIAADITMELVRNGYPAGVDLFSVNIPAEATRSTPRVVTHLSRSRYGRLFVRSGENYRHDFQGVEKLDHSDEGDMVCVENGRVSITPLWLDLSARITADLRQRFERRP